MSLDVMLYEPITETENRIYCKSCGCETKQEEGRNVFDRNITHNLNNMAELAGIYKAMWRPEEIGVTKAGGLIDILRNGVEMLKSEPDKFKTLNPSNGWGSYDVLLLFAESYLQACRDYPNARISVSR